MEQNREDLSLTTSRSAGPLRFVLLAYFFADVLAAAIIRAERRGFLLEVFLMVVFVSQAMLLVMWVGLGNVSIWIRLVCALGWGLLMTLMGTSEPLQWDLEFLAMSGLMLLLAAAPYGLLKVCGFRVVRRRSYIDACFGRGALPPDAQVESRGAAVERVDPVEKPPELHGFQRAGMQFSIAQVFGWTALAGVMAVLAGIAGMGIAEALRMAITISVASAVGFSALWAVLGGERTGARLLATFGVVVVIALVAAALAGPAHGLILEIAFALALCIAPVVGVLGLFRSAGYRVRRTAQKVVNDVEAVKQSSATNPWDAEAR